MGGMSEMSDRLREARVSAGFADATEAANRHGWKASTYLGHENGSRGIKPDVAQQYARAFRVGADWLLFGAGGGPLPVAPSSDGGDLVNVYGVKASAGHGAWVDEYEDVVDRLSFPPGYLSKITKANPKDLAIIGVKGDSMIPTLNDDDVVMVDTSKTSLGFDGLFVFNYDGVLQVKRVGRSGRKGHVTITSDNRSLYPPFEALADEIKVVGKVVWMGVKV